MMKSIFFQVLNVFPWVMQTLSVAFVLKDCRVTAALASHHRQTRRKMITATAQKRRQIPVSTKQCVEQNLEISRASLALKVSKEMESNVHLSIILKIFVVIRRILVSQVKYTQWRSEYRTFKLLDHLINRYLSVLYSYSQPNHQRFLDLNNELLICYSEHFFRYSQSGFKGPSIPNITLFS